VKRPEATIDFSSLSILLSGGFDGMAISVPGNFFFVGRTVVFLLGVDD
jgi:hypothetical protein